MIFICWTHFPPNAYQLNTHFFPLNIIKSKITSCSLYFLFDIHMWQQHSHFQLKIQSSLLIQHFHPPVLLSDKPSAKEITWNQSSLIMKSSLLSQVYMLTYMLTCMLTLALLLLTVCCTKNCEGHTLKLCLLAISFLRMTRKIDWKAECFLPKETQIILQITTYKTCICLQTCIAGIFP